MKPEKIGRYEIKSELGRGGMATVYRGWDPLFEREVAVKVLPPELLHSDPQFKMRFEREAKIIASLEHPSIVPVYDVGDDNGQPYFVMRFMGGGSLSDRIKSKNLTIEEVIKILGHIAPGLDEAHSKGIIHRDLKPSNILFDAKGTPYISDFGIAKLSQAQSSGMTGSAIIGTPAYMAPEQAQGTGVDGRTDIYAVGIILYEMLTGRQPYEADTPMAVAFKHITDPVPNIREANPNLPEDVEAVIHTAMAKDKESRFDTTTELVDSLRTIASGQKLSYEAATVKGPAKTLLKTPTATKTLKKPAGATAEAPVTTGGFNKWLVIVPLALIVLFGGGYFLMGGGNRPEVTETPTPTEAIVATATEVIAQITETLSSIPAITDTPAPTDTPQPPTDTPAPSLPLLGGADKIAFVANNEIWLMNVDGSNLEQLTFDGASKNDLQWLPDGNTILFLSGKTIKYFDITTETVDTLTSFPSEVSVDAFRVSHDGKQVMVAMSNSIWVVPFDFEKFKTITTRGPLTRIEGACIVPTDGTKAALKVREARWSADDRLVAWLYKGNDEVNPNLQAEQVMVLDITSCQPDKIVRMDNFPGSRFTPTGYQTRELPDFDWDGLSLFVFNVARRNEGWGEMYIYNWETHKPTQAIPLGTCCYRDARFSPDGTYIFFAFQDLQLGPEAKTQVFYAPVGDLNTGFKFTPLPLDVNFFKNPREGTQAAIRPAQK
jgi:serine/threonine-protein kinase